MTVRLARRCGLSEDKLARVVEAFLALLSESPGA
jgi:hypothetical protein